jgi:hypothetical protein
MKCTRGNRGSALIISLVIVIITAGIGGAFLAQALIHSKESKWSIEADEAVTMCDAGMELARQTMGAYRGATVSTQKWTWQNMITYCKSRGTIDTVFKKNDAMAFFKSNTFAAYQYWINFQGPTSEITYNNFAAATLTMPYSQTSYSAVDTYPIIPALPAPANPPTAIPMPTLPVPIGNTIAFQRGALFISVDYPDTGTGDPDNALVTVTATMQSGLQRTVQGILSKASAVVPLKANGLAAVVSNDQVSLTGSIIIDGRDHQYTGTSAITTPPPLASNPNGVFGIVSNAAMSNPSNGSVGGNGNPPPQPKGAAPNSIASQYNFGPNGYPQTPDAVLSNADGTPIANGSLKNAAMSQGTYFNNAAAYSSWLSAQPSPMPGGQIIYLDFAPGNGMFDMGPGNVKSSIMVIHTDSESGIAQEVHGSFTGLMIADGFIRNNGNAQITGMVQLLSPTASQAGNVFGNGNAEIDYSSQALANLPGLAGSTPPPTPATLSSYRRIQ